MFDELDSGMLKNSDFLCLLLSAIVKKQGGKLSIGTADIANIKMDECLVLLFNTDLDKFLLSIVPVDETVPESKSGKPTIH
jgi:hypothetical protein